MIDLQKLFKKEIIPPVEEEIARITKKKYMDIRRKGSKFRFFGDWKIDITEGVILESNDTFKILERGESWIEQVAKLKEQGYREVV